MNICTRVRISVMDKTAEICKVHRNEIKIFTYTHTWTYIIHYNNFYCIRVHNAAAEIFFIYK